MDLKKEEEISSNITFLEHWLKDDSNRDYFEKFYPDVKYQIKTHLPVNSPPPRSEV